MKPTRHILDKSFRYTSAAKTDLRKTFARIRREIEAAKQSTPPPPANVATITKRKRTA